MANPIHIFYACDDRFANYAAVSIQSLIDGTNPINLYVIHILNTGFSNKTKEMLSSLKRSNVCIDFINVSDYLQKIENIIPVRDYYSSTTYFRLFIADMFPELNKVVYLDSDTIIRGDVADLYAFDPQDNYLCAAHEQVMVQTPIYGEYVEKVLGIDRNSYFNAGVLVINCSMFREKKMLERFAKLIEEYRFVVTQDEDYLNVLCKDHVRFLPQCWNSEVYGKTCCPDEDIKLYHFVMVSKPWHYTDCRYKELFWEVANRTPVADEIKKELESYTDEQRENDAKSCDRLAQTARNEIEREDNYLKNVRRTQSPDRVAVLEKMEQLESEGIFDKDVEDDPPAPVLKEEDIKYVRRGVLSRVQTKVALSMAKVYVRGLKKKKQIIIKEIKGLENMASLKTGAVITCNHFNAFDSFAISIAYEKSHQRKRRFYRVIREGNYTNFPGFYGYLMRHADTLPLSSSNKTMRKFIVGVNTILQNGDFVLFYPEQSMWWNYRKPKPLKPGAFEFAARNNVPVVPCFITMKDTDIVGNDGFPVQEYTIHIGKPINPKTELSARENVNRLMEENGEVWKNIYEKEYDMPLVYHINESNALN